MTREELQRLNDEATGKYRAAGIARGYSAQAVPALLTSAPTWLAELLAEVDALTARAEAAEQTVRRVRAQCDSWSHGNSWNKAARNAILRALDGGAS